MFVSLRFGDAVNEAAALKVALETEGVTAFSSGAPERPTAIEPSASAIDTCGRTCAMVVVFLPGAEGETTGAPGQCSAHEELALIYEEKKPMFVIKITVRAHC